SLNPGIEARGFIFGTPIALEIGAKFVPLRKPNKLPGNISYRADMHKNLLYFIYIYVNLSVFFPSKYTMFLGKVISEEYELEYGRDCLEMHLGAVEPGERALVVDDLIATGGTLCAAMKLLERAGAEVVECACVIELPDLKVCI
ncbi:hypothetical protein Goshw_006651, partial [Gossypium schwendimanii]|nr:hypothetical protein [Gossypium schwendimanii]